MVAPGCLPTWAQGVFVEWNSWIQTSLGWGWGGKGPGKWEQGGWGAWFLALALLLIHHVSLDKPWPQSRPPSLLENVCGVAVELAHARPLSAPGPGCWKQAAGRGGGAR